MTFQIIISMASGKTLPLRPVSTIEEAKANLLSMTKDLKNPTEEYYDTGNGIIRMAFVESVFISEVPEPVVTHDSNNEVVVVKPITD
jgi:hypothetical protein